MPTITKTWTFDVDAQGWIPQTGSIEKLSFESSLGNPSGCLGNVQTGKGQKGIDSWELEGTWETIFGVPVGSVVTAITASGDGYDSKCDIFVNSISSTSGPLTIFSPYMFLTLVPSRNYSSVDSFWVRQSASNFNQTIPSGSQASNSSILLSLGASVNTGDRSNSENRLLQDNVTITVIYT